MDFHERLYAFLEQENISVSGFEVKMGFSNGSFAKVLDQKRAIGSDRLQKIFEVYPNWNPTWLITGSGPMYRKRKKKKIVVTAEMIEELQRIIRAYERVIYYNELTTDELREQLAEAKIKLRRYTRIMLKEKK